MQPPGGQRNRSCHTIRQTYHRLQYGRFLSATRDKIYLLDKLIGLHMTNFTPEDLLLYLYKETSADQSTAIESALEKDWTLREKLNVLKASMQRLDKLTESPRTQVVLNVLNHAREMIEQEEQLIQ